MDYIRGPQRIKSNIKLIGAFRWNQKSCKFKQWKIENLFYHNGKSTLFCCAWGNCLSRILLLLYIANKNRLHFPKLYIIKKKQLNLLYIFCYMYITYKEWHFDFWCRLFCFNRIHICVAFELNYSCRRCSIMRRVGALFTQLSRCADGRRVAIQTKQNTTGNACTRAQIK